MRTAHVLWTGGWDSTYRVLDLALVQGIHVTPHYLWDMGRESRFHEQDSIKTIRESALARGGSVQPVQTFVREELEISPALSEKHAELRKRFHIGPQYLWLAQYAHEKGIPELELCIHRDDRASGIFEYLQSARNSERGSASAKAANPDDLFSVFALPLLDLTKKEMLESARCKGFAELMELTWFCHRPTRSGNPCGMCNPCRWTEEEGLQYRLPMAARCRRRLDEWMISVIPGFRVKRGIRAWLRKMG